MSVAVSTAALAASASASASIAASNAARIQARKAECMGVIDRFDSNGATVAQAQEYASCVQTVYPVHEEMSPNAIIAAKSAMVVAIVFVVVFCIWFGKKERDGFIGYFLGFTLAFIVLGCFALTAWALLSAFKFLIS